MRHFGQRAVLFAMSLLLAACATQAPPPSPPVAQPSVSMTDRDRIARLARADPSEAAVLISQYRQAHGLSAVVPDPTLQKLAQAQASAMAAHDVLSHTVAGTLTQRFDAAHLAQAAAVENVSAGYFSQGAALAGWKKSPPHNANLLSPKMRRLGIATAYAPGTRYLDFWALDMSN